MIYLKLRGRLGNQLFMYATVKAIQRIKADNAIIIDDSENVSLRFENMLEKYNLDNVLFTHNTEILKRKPWINKWIINMLHEKLVNKLGLSYRERGKLEVGLQWWFNLWGMVKAQDEYVNYPHRFKKNVYVDGYFQCEKFFEPVKEEVREIFYLKDEVLKIKYKDIKKINERNTVCISIKVQDNVNNKMYHVCDMAYYQKAIEYIVARVENPLFLICSDDVQYVKEHLIDVNNLEYIEQDKSVSDEIALAAMARSKHFIIGNSSFSWWAQYLCRNENKIVIAPSKWYGIDVPCHIYQDSWINMEGY